MNKEHYNHLKQILEEFSEKTTEKYIKGQEEHGGRLWEKSGLIDMLIEELIDGVVYALTLKKQLEGTREQWEKLREESE